MSSEKAGGPDAKEKQVRVKAPSFSYIPSDAFLVTTTGPSIKLRFSVSEDNNTAIDLVEVHMSQQMGIKLRDILTQLLDVKPEKDRTPTPNPKR